MKKETVISLSGLGLLALVGLTLINLTHSPDPPQPEPCTCQCFCELPGDVPEELPND